MVAGGEQCEYSPHILCGPATRHVTSWHCWPPNHLWGVLMICLNIVQDSTESLTTRSFQKKNDDYDTHAEGSSELWRNDSHPFITDVWPLQPQQIWASIWSSWRPVNSQCDNRHIIMTNVYLSNVLFSFCHFIHPFWEKVCHSVCHAVRFCWHSGFVCRHT